MRAALALALLMTVLPARAAQFSVGSFAGSIPIIDVSGQIFDGDDQRFKLFADAIPFAVVRLNSPGGHLLAALSIGEMVHAKGFATYVSPGQTCASSCGFLWLAGQPRGMAPTAKIGFHAAYETVDGKKEEVGAANAIVGAYMTKLHLPLGAVVWATLSHPDQMAWLTPEVGRTTEIAFDSRDEVETTHWSTAAPAVQTATALPSAPVPLPGAQPPAAQPVTWGAPSGTDAPVERKAEIKPPSPPKPKPKPPVPAAQATAQPGLADALGDLLFGRHVAP